MALPVPTNALTAGGIALRRWQASDAEWYVAARDEEIFAWTDEPRLLSADLVREAITRNDLEPRFVGLAITDAFSGALLGNLALRPTDDWPEEAEISYWLAPAARGRGAATISIRLLIGWTFDNSTIDRIRLRTKPGNLASQAVASRAGFRQVGEEGGHSVFTLSRPATPVQGSATR